MEREHEDQEYIPLFGKCNKWYAFLLIVLFVQVILYTWLTYSYL